LDIASNLLKAGANVEEVNDKGNTPLHVAVKLGYQEMVILLLKFGADNEVKNRDGRKPLVMAAESCRVDMIYLLLDHGARVFARVSTTSISSLCYSYTNMSFVNSFCAPQYGNNDKYSLCCTTPFWRHEDLRILLQTATVKTTSITPTQLL
jgi:ankyrin repeat protein